MTIQASAPGRTALAAILRILVVFDAAALLFAGIVHLVGASIPLGVATFDEPPILPAGIVESLAGVLFVVAAYAIFARQSWAWGMTLAAHLFAILGFIVGILATLNGTTPFNTIYHRVMLAVFTVGLILLLIPLGRAALHGGRSSHDQ
jgi:hypothetical protein